ncbi:MAG: sigma-70 family RNA polymerase sigma factor [Rikenellaceae bacterium]
MSHYIYVHTKMKSIDEILVEKLKGGDRGAQQELYNLYAATLMAIAMRYLGERSTAEDMLHDAFIKIFHSIGTFKYRGSGSLKAWMCRIMVNISLEQLRRNRNKTLSLDSMGGNIEIEAEPIIEASRVPQERLLEFVAELPPGYRTVFNLFCIEGYSHREIARELNINEKSSSSQLLRAKRILADKIKNYIELHG